MSWRKRIGLALGLLSVLVLAAGLTMVVNYNSGKVESKSASLAASDYPVGTDYSGTITAQYVKVGDQVKARITRSVAIVVEPGELPGK